MKLSPGSTNKLTARAWIFDELDRVVRRIRAYPFVNGELSPLLTDNWPTHSCEECTCTYSQMGVVCGCLRLPPRVLTFQARRHAHHSSRWESRLRLGRGLLFRRMHRKAFSQS